MPVDPTKPVALIWRQIKDGQKFATAAGIPFSPQQIETLLLGTNCYHDVYHTQLMQPPMNRTYANLKIYLNNEYQLQNTLNTTT
eukprot:13709503-Ditylum_brightwellii.AAC.1